MRTGSLYKITFPNGKFYIGITSQSVKDRFSAHRRAALSGFGVNAIHHAIRKYGPETAAVETLASGVPWSQLLKLEQSAIEQYGSRAPSGYNETAGGEGRLGVPLSPEHKEKMSWTGRKHSPDSIKRMRLAQLGRERTEEERVNRAEAMRRPEVRAKLAAAAAGLVQSDETIEKRAAKNRGQKRTAETRELMRNSQLGKKATEETRAKIGAASAARRHSPEAREKIATAMREFRERQRHARALTKSHANPINP